MIVGIGVDIVDIARFAASLERAPALRVRLFTDAERELPVRSLAARFAAKEAVAKALGAQGDLRWHHCSVGRGKAGEPVIETSGTVAARAAELGVVTWHLSLSHDGGVAVAMVVAER